MRKGKIYVQKLGNQVRVWCDATRFMLLSKHAYNLLFNLIFNIMANSKKEIFDCAIIIRLNEDEDVCLKYKCNDFDEAVKKLHNFPFAGKVVSFMFGDFHTFKK